MQDNVSLSRLYSLSDFNGGITPNMSEQPSFVESPDSPSCPKKTVTFGGTHWSKLEQNAEKHRANSLQNGNMVQLVGLTNHPSMDERTGYIEDTQIMKKIRLQDGTFGWVPEHNLAPVNGSMSPNDVTMIISKSTGLHLYTPPLLYTPMIFANFFWILKI